MLVATGTSNDQCYERYALDKIDAVTGKPCKAT